MRPIESGDLMHIGFLKKDKYTGSSEGLRYRLEKAVQKDADGAEETRLRAVCWPEPYCYDATPDSQKQDAFFSFDEAGVEEARLWLNRMKEETGCGV